MSIGKNSIARAAGSAAPAPAARPAQPEVPSVAHLPVEPAAVGFLKGAAPTSADGAPSTLLTSIRRRGVLTPVLLARTPDGALWLLEGYRRLDAAKTLKLAALPAVVVPVESEWEALRLFDELQGTRRATADVREGKFRAAAMMDHDMPTYLL